MSGKQSSMRDAARKLLSEGAVSYVIAWGEARIARKTAPIFVRSEEEAARIVWNEYTIPSLAKYVIEDRFGEEKIGLFVRGCESRAILRLIKDNQIKRDHLYLIGLPCEGKNAARCKACRSKNPLIYDELLWDLVPDSEPEEGRFARVSEIEAMSADQRFAYWSDVYSRCIRCYACRQICPVCSCRECYVDMNRTGFQGKRHSVSDNQTFGVTRAFHVGDRCIECGECERVCPMGLPIRGQTQKIIKDIVELAGDYEQGLNAEDENFLGRFDLGDKDGFM